MSETPTGPEHELDGDLEPDPANESAENPQTPSRPSTGGASASKKPSPEDADEGKDPEDISPAQVV